MKKIGVFILFSSLVSALILSCNKSSYDFESKYEGDKLVANGFLEETGVTVSLSKTSRLEGSHILSDYDVQKGRVWLYRMDTLLFELSSLGNGKFGSKNFIPKVGETFSIKAVAEGLDTIVSKNIVLPPPPSVISYKIVKNDSLVIYGDKNTGAALYKAIIQDDVAQKNIYMIGSFIQVRADSINNYNLQQFLDASTFESCEFEEALYKTFFTDKCFNGNEYEISYVSDHQRKGTWVVELSSIDQNFLSYLRTWQQPTGLERGFVEPKTQYSNIRNGSGVFVAKNTKTFKLKLD